MIQHASVITAILGSLLLPVPTAQTPTRPNPKPSLKLQHPVYYGEPIQLSHPVWDGRKPTVLLIDESDRQFRKDHPVLNSVSKTSVVVKVTGGKSNAAQKK